MWDVHYRIGGAIGTNIQPGNCPSGDGTGAPASQCSGSWGLLHIADTGNLYMENVLLLSSSLLFLLHFLIFFSLFELIVI